MGLVLNSLLLLYCSLVRWPLTFFLRLEVFVGLRGYKCQAMQLLGVLDEAIGAWHDEGSSADFLLQCATSDELQNHGFLARVLEVVEGLIFHHGKGSISKSPTEQS